MTAKLKKSVFIVAIMVLITLQGAAPVFAARNFVDLEGHWAESFVAELSLSADIPGVNDGLFHPDEFITTEQFFTAFFTAYAKLYPEGSSFNPPYLKAAGERGLIDAFDESVKDAPISRYTTASFCHVFMNSILGEEEAAYVSTVERFADYNLCESCLGHMEQCYFKGIITGKPGRFFDGNANLTRAEAATIIMKMLDPQLRTPPAANQD